MAGPESLFRKRVDAALKKLPNSYFESIQQVAIRGTPDKLGVVNGRFVALELKARDGRVHPLQAMKLLKYEEAGALVFVANPTNWEEIWSTLVRLSRES